jgi:signal peptidase
VRDSLDYKKYRKISIAMLLTFIALFINTKILMKWIDPDLLNYRILPLIWICFILIFLRFIPRVHPIGRISMLEMMYLEAVVCAAVFTGIRFLAGSMIGELGESPYIMTPVGIFNNLIFALPPLISREITRSYFLGAFCNKPNVKIFILITAIMTLCDINYVSLAITRSLHEFIIFIAEEFGPLLSQHILLSYLALYGGYPGALSYLGIVTLFNWTSPILPVLNWLAEGSIGILVPIFSLLFIIKKYENRVNNEKNQQANRWDAVQWMITIVFSIGLIWFVVGVFPIVPSVIATGSMEPLIKPGDIVLLEKIDSEKQIQDLRKGDIIQFQRDDIRITHRIIEIDKDPQSGSLSFRTKGDNNSGEDVQPVAPNDIKGIYVQVIPRLGYPTLLLKGRTGGDTGNDIVF